MKQVILGGGIGSADLLPTTGTEYQSLHGISSSSVWTTTYAWRRVLFPVAGKLKSLRVELSNYPGSGKSYQFYIVKNLTVTSLSTLISDTNLIGTNTEDEVDIEAGDVAFIGCTAINGPEESYAKGWAVEFEPTEENINVFVAGTGNFPSNTGVEQFLPLHAGSSWSDTSLRETVIPHNTTLKKFRINLSSAPGSGNAYTFKLQKNGVDIVGTSIVITDSETTGSLQLLNEVLVAGDTIRLSCQATSGTPVNTFVYYGAAFQPETDGESMMAGMSDDNMNNTTDQVVRFNDSGITSWDSSSNEHREILSVGNSGFTLRDFRVKLSGEPASGKSYTFKVRKDLADGNSSVIIADTNTTAVDSVNSDVFTAGQFISLYKTQANTPTARLASWGAVMYIEPPISKTANDTQTISESVSLLKWSHGLDIRLGSTNITDKIIPSSFSLENILTRQPDICRFTVRNLEGSITTKPESGDEITMYYNGEKIFGGIAVRVTQKAEDYKVILFDVECEDYTRLMQKKLVYQIFEQNTIEEIVATFIENSLPEGFYISEMTGGDTVINYIAFDYETVSDCMTQLADMINHDWYVDPEKGIHFISKTDKSAPFNIADEDGSYDFSSLRIRSDITQMRNRIFIRGGEYLADTLTTEFESDGVQNVYILPYKYEDIYVSVTGILWDGGIDGESAITQYDYLWNKSEKFIRFRGDRIPNTGSGFNIVGRPYLPVRLVRQDADSIAHFATAEGGDGISDFLIVDSNINTIEAARERANAELDAYKDSISEGEFITFTSGLKAGQRIRINSTAHSIDSYYVINKVSWSMKNNRELRFIVSLITTRTFGIIELLQSLVKQNKGSIKVNEDVTIDLTEFATDSFSVTVSEVDTTMTSSNYRWSPAGTNGLKWNLGEWN